MGEEQGRVGVTGIGVAVVASAVAMWVGLLAYGYGEPELWIGKLVRTPIGIPALILGISFLLLPIEKYLGHRGKPLFLAGQDVQMRAGADP